MFKVLNLISWLNISVIEDFLNPKWIILNGSQFPKEKIRSKLPEGYQALIAYNPNPIYLELLISPKVVISPAAGFEWADKNKFQEQGIRLVNNHANAITVAEHAWGLLLDQAKMISYNDRKIRELTGSWPDIKTRFARSIGLFGKKIGIMGFGAIGKEIAKRARAFEMEIWAYKLSKPHVEESLLFDHYFLPHQLEDFLEGIDFLIVALPVTSKTTNLLNAKTLTLLKPTCILINISRSEIIDEKALYNLLKSKKIFGAGIDPLFLYPYQQKDTKEPKIANYPFHSLQNLTISPHRAWSSDHAVYEVSKQIANNLNLIANDRIDELSFVNFEKEY